MERILKGELPGVLIIYYKVNLLASI